MAELESKAVPEPPSKEELRLAMKAFRRAHQAPAETLPSILADSGTDLRPPQAKAILRDDVRLT